MSLAQQPKLQAKFNFKNKKDVLIMRILNNEKKIVFEGKFDVSMLDLKHVDNQGNSLLIPLVDFEVQMQTKDIAWDNVDSHDWIGLDSDKTNTYLFVSYGNAPVLMVESFPYLPNDNDMTTELNGFKDKDGHDSMEGYYQEIQDWYAEHKSCGEFDTLNVQFDSEELKSLNLICKV